MRNKFLSNNQMPVL